MIEIAWNHEIVRSPIFLLVIPRYPDKRTRERIEGAFFSQKKRDQTRGRGGEARRGGGRGRANDSFASNTHKRPLK